MHYIVFGLAVYLAVRLGRAQRNIYQLRADLSEERVHAEGLCTVIALAPYARRKT